MAITGFDADGRFMRGDGATERCPRCDDTGPHRWTEDKLAGVVGITCRRCGRIFEP